MIATILIGTLIGYATYTTKRIYDLEKEMVDLRVSNTCPDCQRSPDDVERNRIEDLEYLFFLADKCLSAKEYEKPLLVEELNELCQSCGLTPTIKIHHEEK